MDSYLLKITFIKGLKEIVRKELSQYHEVAIVKTKEDAFYISYFAQYQILTKLRSSIAVFIVLRDSSYNPFYISHHKSILGSMIADVLSTDPSSYKTFCLHCAGDESKEVRDTKRYVRETFVLQDTPEADLDITIAKSEGTWELAVRTTPRPLSVRNYRVEHMSGGINPTIAYAINTLCIVEDKTTYLNIFSGTATLLIEAAYTHPTLTLVGFDRDGKTNARAIQNIKKAGFLKKIHLMTKDIFDNQDTGIFDCITANLPFGMQISKGEDLSILYTAYIKYCAEHLTEDGVLGVYTSEDTVFEACIKDSPFVIANSLTLTLPTATHAYLHTTIFICKRA